MRKNSNILDKMKVGGGMGQARYDAFYAAILPMSDHPTFSASRLAPNSSLGAKAVVGQSFLL